MRIGVINAGNIGRTLARAWLRKGHEIMLAKDGNQEKLGAFVAENPDAQRGTIAEAAQFGEAVLFSVYWPRLDAVLDAVGSLNGKLVIDTMNPLTVSSDFEHSYDEKFMARSSTSEELQRRLPRARVVKAFSTVPSNLLDERSWTEPRHHSHTPDPGAVRSAREPRAWGAPWTPTRAPPPSPGMRSGPRIA